MNDTSRAGTLAQIKAVYTASRKERDVFWNVYIARPIAACVVFFMAKTSITPNQVSFLGAFLFFGVAAALVLVLNPWGMLLAALALQASYIFDCADGQLARLTGKTSGVGAFLDFLIDEFKALILAAAAATRLWRTTQDEVWLIAATLGVMLVAIATSLTTFVRRPEYAGEEIKPGVHKEKPIPSTLIGKSIWLAERIAQWLIHYPSWFLYVALLDFIPGVDGSLLFFVAYMGVYALYVARTSLAVLIKLGRPSFYAKP